MRWPPIILTLALAIALWTVVLRTVRQRRARVAADPSPRGVRSYRLHAAGLMSATVGVTWFFAWLLTDALGPHWLHALSLPAALVFIAVGAVLSGYAGWVGGL
jgi:hypothetical protein